MILICLADPPEAEHLADPSEHLAEPPERHWILQSGSDLDSGQFRGLLASIRIGSSNPPLGVKQFV